MAVGMSVFDGPESWQQSLGETMPNHRHTLERVLALLVSRGLACLFGLRISADHRPPSAQLGGSSDSAGSQRSTLEPDISKR